MNAIFYSIESRFALKCYWKYQRQCPGATKSVTIGKLIAMYSIERYWNLNDLVDT